jgi:hypothetical protein
MARERLRARGFNHQRFNHNPHGGGEHPQGRGNGSRRGRR